MEETRRQLEDTYYERLFAADPQWSSPFPNEDEALRWDAIAHVLSLLPAPAGNIGRILDVGCGRGWLVKKLSEFGAAEGIEPVGPVVAHARGLFPELTFHVGTTRDLLAHPGFTPFDLVVSSEVIEHVEDDQKPNFVQALRDCVATGGHAVVTTPRKEVFELLRSRGWVSQQPVEAWLSEGELAALFANHGFVPIRHETIFMLVNDNLGTTPNPQAEQADAWQSLPIYQLWCFRAV